MNRPTSPEPWIMLRRLLRQLRAVSHRDDWLEQALDSLVGFLDADRGLVSVREAGGDFVVYARSAEGELSRAEWQEASQSVVHRVHETGQSAVWEVGDDGSASLASLGIVAVAAAPIRPVGSEGPPIGVLYIDYRRPRRMVSLADLEVLEAVGDMVAVLLDRGRELARAQQAAADTRVEDALPSLEELLAPESMRGVRDELATLGEDTPLLVTGESGTGKTLLCHAIAEASSRRPIVRALLGSTDDLNTLTSELFGHERGAFSGATRRRAGLVAQANGGVLILDELLSLPLHTQQLLLDVTQFGTYRPLGWTGREPRRTDVRIIAATNGDLEGAVAAGRFREDLMYRLAGARIHVPPLRERRQDIAPLAQGILSRLDPEGDWRLSLGLRRWLASPDLRWSGNVRQLAMAIRRARDRCLASDPEARELQVVHLRDRDVHDPLLPEPRSAPAVDAESYAALEQARDALDEKERALLRRELDRHEGVVARVARSLKIPRTTLVSRLERLGIERRRKG
ncbi:MAG: sigma-54-dependent Fis family transcriptional regulator [Deltaproteobacteria bacterium]|nr:sigma-54-dependent Fis family transcriptional regulator [Deltaproteobacteria bacterium]